MLKHLQVPDRVAALALLVPAGVYLATLLPGVGHTGDSAELALSGHVLGVPHPTGYPLYVLVANLFDRLVPFGSVAWKANLLSAVCASGALVALLRLQRDLGISALAALAATLGLAFSPTFWRHAIVAEVYAPHALLFTAALLLFLRFERSGRRGDLYAACAVYALSFGNHLLMLTLLPAIAWLVWSRDRAAFKDPRAVAAVAAIVAVCASQYLFLLWRGGPGVAPYRAAEIGGFGDLAAFATGRQFQASMFAIAPARLASERLPFFASTWLVELGPWLLLVPVGLASLGRTRAGVFLLLALAANLAFALGYDIPDLLPYFIPGTLLAAVFAGAGLDRLARGTVRAPALALAFLLVAALAAWRAPAVIRDSGRDAARRALLLADELPRGIVVLGYHDYQFLNYLKLAEGRGAQLYPAHLVETADLRAYLRDSRPLALPQLGLVVPPGLPVYSAKLNHREAYRAAGLRAEPWKWGVLRLSDARAGAAADVSAGEVGGSASVVGGTADAGEAKQHTPAGGVR
jgi:hypothetical protein